MEKFLLNNYDYIKYLLYIDSKADVYNKMA